MSRWVFVRHGESVANAEGWLSGHIDTPLTETGWAQARELGARLREQSFGRAFCSDLLRARQTAEGLGVAFIETPALRERDLGDWSERERVTLRSSGEMARLLTWEGRPEGGESQADIAARAMPWFASQEPIEGATLIVAHGGLIRVVLGLLDGVPRSEIGRNRIENCVPHVREVAPGRFQELCP